MSSGWFDMFTGGSKRKEDAQRKKSSQAIVDLRANMAMLEKKEKYLEAQIDEEQKKAKANANTNKALALTAIKRRKQRENELIKLQGTKDNLELQMNALEQANMNVEMLNAMKRGGAQLKTLQSQLGTDKVEDTMDEIRDTLERAEEISAVISNPITTGQEMDQSELEEELDALQTEALNERLVGAPAVPLHSPPTEGVPAQRQPARTTAEEEEEDELRQLQAELAM